MELNNPQIRTSLDRIISAILADRTILTRTWKTEMDNRRITAENLSDLAGNHLFDEAPELFGITKYGGLVVRKYLAGESSTNYNYVLELHLAYPNAMESEREEFLRKVNEKRAILGLELIGI